MQVNKNTVFLLRHKVLNSLSEIRKGVKLTGCVEADETYKLINLKGTKTRNMPRYSKCRSSKGGSKRGVSKHQVCIASAIDEKDNQFLEIVGIGPITSKQVEKVFQERMDEVSCFITDCKSSYEKLKNVRLEQVKSGTYKNTKGYSLGNINSLHSDLSFFLSSFRGVSAKHLQHYLDWFSFQKMINYTVEILKRPLLALKKTIVHSCHINSNNVFDNQSGIDFNEAYHDFNFSSPTI